MHITLVNIDGILVSFDIENEVGTLKNGLGVERVVGTATFKKRGEVIHKIYNIGNFDYLSNLLDRDFAIEEAKRMIDMENKSAHSPFKAVCSN